MSTERQWWKEAVVYQIWPRSFQDSNGDGIGDLKGITSRLDYLKELGVNVVWLSPCYQSPNHDMGYDVSDYRDILPEFGTRDDWKEMLREMHSRGIKLVMDLVVNHCSDEHPWFVESRSSRDNPKRDFFYWRDGRDGNTKPPNNWTSYFSGPAWEFDEETKQWYLHLFTKKQPDLNWENEEVRREVYDLMKFWLDLGVDGFRMDVISLISEPPGLPDGDDHGQMLVGPDQYAHGPREHEFLQEMHREVLSKYNIMTVGECAFVTIEEANKYTDSERNELNMVFQFDLMDVDAGEWSKWFPREWKLSEFKAIQTKWQTQLGIRCWNSLFLSNHDQPRPVSRFGNDSDEWRVISAKMLATMNHTLRGTPYIYQGEEIAMTNVQFDRIDDFRDVEIFNLWRKYVVTGKLDPKTTLAAINKIGRDNARTPFQWDTSTNAGFTTGTPWIRVNPNYTKINASAALADPDSVFHYYKRLIQLRHEYPIIVYGDYTIYLPEDEHLYVYTRQLDGHLLFVALNFKLGTFKLELPPQLDVSDCQLLISNYPNTNTIPKALRPYEAVVYYK